MSKKDWINKSLIKEINERNILWHQWKQSPQDEQLKKDFMQKRKITLSKIQTTKNEYYLKAFNNYRNDPLKMWRLINCLTNNKIDTFSVPLKLNSPSGLITETIDICECFNSFFATIGTDLANKILKKHNYNQTYTLSANQSKINKNKLSEFNPTTPDEIVKIINNLDANSSSGIDGISTKAIKCVKNIIAVNLSKCINRCFEEAYFPDSLKIAKVCPIFKSGDKTDPGNYRPISVLPVLSKVFEKVFVSTFY